MQWPLLLKDNAAAAATTLTIRHSRFATLTLAKLVASLALHPPVSATEADYAPQGEAFAEDDLLNCRSLPRLISAHNQRPVARRF